MYDNKTHCYRLTVYVVNLSKIGQSKSAAVQQRQCLMYVMSCHVMSCHVMATRYDVAAQGKGGVPGARVTFH
jgi:hypothetical protein